MWIAIGAVALFILYFVIKKNLDKASADETTTIDQNDAPLEIAAEEEKDVTPSAKTTPEVEVKAEVVKETKPTPKQATAKKVEPNTTTTQKAAPKKAAAKKPAVKKAVEKKAAPTADSSEYSTQYSALSDSYKSAQEFTLFDSKAAFFSNEGDKTVALLSITAFVKGIAKTETYNTYSFNVVDWVWDGEQPKGCAAEIKKHLSERFKKGETA